MSRDSSGPRSWWTRLELSPVAADLESAFLELTGDVAPANPALAGGAA